MASVNNAIQNAYQSDPFAQATISASPATPARPAKRRRIAPENLSPTPQSQGGTSAYRKFTGP